ncbi:uncharacterized protein [Branchiostoma lanceolatum]|uniref:uncharacterized protein n=1 Tax=Branchiostoma lanceolatum TaxID=7740 RepID=UPI0034525616
MTTGHHHNQHGQQSYGSRQGGRHNNSAAYHEQPGGVFHGQHGYDHQREMELREMQIKEQRHRSLQASKQMVYDVYATTIGMLEEFEDFDDPAGPEGFKDKDDGKPKSRETAGPQHEMMEQQQDPWRTKSHHGPGQAENGKQGKGQHGKKNGVSKNKRGPGRSDIKLPDQSQKTRRDVKAIVEAELVCLQAQLRFCPPEIRDQTRKELVDKTLGWVAAREKQGLKKGLADAYASQVVEILLTGGTKLQVPTQWEESTGPAGEEAVMGGVQALQRGQHYGAEQDKQFHDDPNKKAQCPKIRSGPVPEIHGAQRLVDVNPHLREHFESDLR